MTTFFLLLLQLFSWERKEKHNLQKPFSCTSLSSRQFLKRLNAYPDISYVMADQEIFAELKLAFCKLLWNFWNWLPLCGLKIPCSLISTGQRGKKQWNVTLPWSSFFLTVKYYLYYISRTFVYYCQIIIWQVLVILKNRTQSEKTFTTTENKPFIQQVSTHASPKVAVAMKLKDACSLGKKKLWQTLCIKKQRHHFAGKVCIVKAMVFPVVM